MVAALAALVVGLAVPASATPKPTVAEVMKELTAVSHKAEALTEQYNKAVADVASAKRAADDAIFAASVAKGRFMAASGSLRATLIEQYKGGPVSATGALVQADSSQQYADRLAMTAMLAHHRAGVTATMRVASKDATDAQHTADRKLADAKKIRDKLAKQKSACVKQQAKVKALLAQLTAKQRQTYFGNTKPVGKWTPVPAPSAKAGEAVQFALDQRGKPYQWGAAGPSTYDCSGLTMAAWAVAGVHLSHYAPTQMQEGTPIARSQLAPGDLVFFYPNIGHVAMYIGRGMIVHAPTTGDVVKIVALSTFDSDYQGARRYG